MIDLLDSFNIVSSRTMLFLQEQTNLMERYFQ